MRVLPMQNIGEKLNETKEILEENAKLYATKPVDEIRISKRLMEKTANGLQKMQILRQICGSAVI